MEEHEMPSFSGSYSAKLGSQTVMSVSDRTDHLIGVSVVSAIQKSSDAKWNGAKVTIWGATDTVGGNGEQRGYFRNEHSNGDVDQGTFEAKLTLSGTETTIAGTWRSTGGTGMFAKITANGVFNGKQTSPTDSDATWSGSYDLG
jgi:hypothetical protein